MCEVELKHIGVTLLIY